jgi:hypothetical protein
MNTQPNGTGNAGRGHFEAALADCIAAIWRGCPMLCGFAVDAESYVSTLTCHPELDGEGIEMVREQVALALSGLLDEEPGTAELLRGRTFARTLH